MKKTKHRLLSLTALLALVLVGCQNNNEQSTATSESQESISSESSSSKEEPKAKESSNKESKKEEASSEEKTKSESNEENAETESSSNESSVPSIAGDLGRTTSQQGLDIDQIQQGDLSTLVGTWRNAKGQEFVFYEDGRVDPHHYLYLGNAKKENQILFAGLNATDGYIGGALLIIAPAGIQIEVPIPSSFDASDISRDRLIGGHNYDVIEDPNEFFYRVD
ncbi:DUF6287 domain-containing protein [Aerococcus urinae]|uniref:DUF6287 domain-containing protein n=1 Tax=Aerococcus TaxID=1375 RepID=UPI000DCF4C38|nr:MULTISPECIES: DUF6287 domain-containing protein [Aerococcus]MCY3034528.1 DUF6287 domain-containing protein [Aerococcus mictus]MCY3063482.1 DUF6287 domain-containing protein [Aerococcus mictus]MCY3072903.1 DUF6287 domain-containing protein [Aerococcus mictus]MDK7195244.1 DUF6287 domain-containing protein [Aerococcus urinae]MDK7716356.1 DUF6287 domain-containing protein [Aerococcus urinae]